MPDLWTECGRLKSPFANKRWKEWERHLATEQGDRLSVVSGLEPGRIEVFQVGLNCSRQLGRPRPWGSDRTDICYKPYFLNTDSLSFIELISGSDDYFF